MVDIHTHTPRGTALEVQSVLFCEPGRSYPAPPALVALGIHPWDAGWLDIPAKRALFAELEANPGIIAIGEIGLDYVRDVNRTMQADTFNDQLKIAARRHLPVVIHCVHAFEPVMKMLSGYKLRAVVFHGFTGSFEQAVKAIQAGYYLSFGHRSLASPRTLNAMRRIPRERMFLETDQDDATIEELYVQAAGILEIPIEELQDTIYKNFKTVFG